MPINVRGLELLSLKGVTARVADLSAVFEEARDAGEVIMRATEAGKKSPSGRRWRPRSNVIVSYGASGSTTRARRTTQTWVTKTGRVKTRPRRSKHQLLMRTGALFNSLQVIATRHGVTFDFTAPYARYVQTGSYKKTKHGQRKVPARSISPRKEPRKGPMGAWLRAVKEAIQAYVTESKKTVRPAGEV